MTTALRPAPARIPCLREAARAAFAELFPAPQSLAPAPQRSSPAPQRPSQALQRRVAEKPWLDPRVVAMSFQRADGQWLFCPWLMAGRDDFYSEIAAGSAAASRR
jgi:hypothetical protein